MSEREEYSSVASDRLVGRMGNFGGGGKLCYGLERKEVIGRFDFERLRREKIWRQTEGRVRVESVGHQFTKTQIVFSLNYLG